MLNFLWFCSCHYRAGYCTMKESYANCPDFSNDDETTTEWWNVMLGWLLGCWTHFVNVQQLLHSTNLFIYIYTSQATRPRISSLVEKKQFFFKFLDYFGFLRSSPGIYGLVRVFTVKSGFRLFFSQLVSDNVCFPTLWKEHFRRFPNSSPSQRNMFPVYSRVIS